MLDRPAFQKAKLETEQGETLECWLNPTQYAITKTNSWQSTEAAPGASFPPAQYSGGQAREMSLELMFDAGPEGDVTSVTDKLFKLMEPVAELGKSGVGRPPHFTLSWGTFQSFDAVCKSLNVTFLLFKPDGTPTRAKATLSLMQVHKDPRSGGDTPAAKTNPTSRATHDAREHVVREGDSLPSIAFAHLGDPTRWRVIAEKNGIDDPLRLQPGRRLRIPGEPR
jgi:Contractile injection system tube protein/LysM domain